MKQVTTTETVLLYLFDGLTNQFFVWMDLDMTLKE